MDIGYFQDIYVEKHFKDKVNSAEQAELGGQILSSRPTDQTCRGDDEVAKEVAFYYYLDFESPAMILIYFTI